MFKRRRAEDDIEDLELDDETAGDDDDDEEETPLSAVPAKTVLPLVRPEGPWDDADAPADELLDLGGLRVPVVEGYDLSITADGDVPVVVTYGTDEGVMQIHAFAAPRTVGIWSEVRDEIAESLRTGGGQAEDTTGPFGGELAAMIPVEQPDGRAALQQARFIGVDGPRWFLRALITGPILSDATATGELEGLLRRVVVVRGNEAMAPRDIIALKLPRELAAAAEAAEADTEESQPESPTLSMPERGPEITETR